MPPKPCPFFNTKACLKPVGNCAYTHEPDKHSFHFIPGGPNYCKRQVLSVIDIGSGCKIKDDNCWYRHYSGGELMPAHRSEMDIVLVDLLKSALLDTPKVQTAET